MSMKFCVKTTPSPWDLLVAAAIVAAAAACFAGLWAPRSAPGALTAVVSIDGVQADRVLLDGLDAAETRTYASRGYTLEVSFDRTGAAVLTADCPNQDCVHSGRIDRVGESIVCLPGRVSIQLSRSGESGGVDAVIG